MTEVPPGEFSVAPEVLRPETRFISGTISDLAWGLDRGEHVNLAKRMDEITEKTVTSPELSTSLDIVYDYVRALRTGCNRNTIALEVLYYEHPEKRGKEREVLLEATLDRYPADEIDKIAAMEQIANAGDNITFTNYDGILLLEVTEEGMQVLKDIKIMPKNAIGLFVPLKDFQYIVVPKEGKKRRGIIEHEIHHFALRSFLGASRTHFDQAKDEFMAYALEYTWIPGTLHRSQLVYDQKHSDNLPDNVAQDTEKFLLYALVCQALSQRGHFTDDESLAGIILAADNNAVYDVLDREFHTSKDESNNEYVDRLFDGSTIGRMLKLYFERKAVANAEQRTIEGFTTAWQRIFERKGWDKFIVKNAVLQHVQWIIMHDHSFWAGRDEEELRAKKLEAYFERYKPFIASIVGEEISQDEFNKAILSSDEQ